MFWLLFAVWNGVVFVRQGLYQDGVFRFTVEFAANFPDSECPVNFSVIVCVQLLDEIAANIYKS